MAAQIGLASDLRRVDSEKIRLAEKKETERLAALKEAKCLEEATELEMGFRARASHGSTTGPS